MEVDVKKYQKNKRTEEVQDIIDRMPSKFGLWVTFIVIMVFVLLFVFGWLVRYPDVVPGQITINANEAPIKLIANTGGRLKLNTLKSMEEVKEGQIIAYLQNSAELTSVLTVDSLLKTFDPSTDAIEILVLNLPSKPSLGELNSRYNAFVNGINELNNYNTDKLLDKQIDNLNSLLAEQITGIEISSIRAAMVKQNLDYFGKFYKRDSILFLKKVISESDLDKANISYLSSKDGYQNSISTLVSNRMQAKQTEGKVRELIILKAEKLKELKIVVTSTYNDLVDNIKNWEQKYLFRAPFDGKIQFLKFWVDNQYITGGESVFTVIPKMGKAMGQVVVSIYGAGKIAPGQEVIVKLDNFPYTEYGSIKGVVRTIGLSPNTSKTEKGDIDNYLITVEFPNQLKTNYGAVLDVKLEAKGSAEIITKDRKLIERFFDNLQYVVKK